MGCQRIVPHDMMFKSLRTSEAAAAAAESSAAATVGKAAGTIDRKSLERIAAVLVEGGKMEHAEFKVPLRLHSVGAASKTSDAFDTLRIRLYLSHDLTKSSEEVIQFVQQRVFEVTIQRQKAAHGKRKPAPLSLKTEAVEAGESSYQAGDAGASAMASGEAASTREAADATADRDGSKLNRTEVGAAAALVALWPSFTPRPPLPLSLDRRRRERVGSPGLRAPGNCCTRTVTYSV